MGRSSDARERLMAAAHALIWGSSYGSVTIETICQRAKVKKGSFYYFFDSKADLAVAAINAWWDERLRILGEVFHRDVPPLERVGRYIDFVVERQRKIHLETGQVLGCPLCTLGSEISTQDERLRLLVQEYLAALAQHFEMAIRDAQAMGDAAPGDPAARARQVWAFYEGTLTRARIENNPDALNHLRVDALELMAARPLLAAA